MELEEEIKEIAMRKLKKEAEEVLEELRNGSQIGITSGYFGHDISDGLNLVIIKLLENYVKGAK